MVGCSNGGRHALVGATRLAKEFDGFLAGAPGYNLPMVSLQHAWDLQSFEKAGGDIRKALSRDGHAGRSATPCEPSATRSTARPTASSARIAQCQKTFDIEKLRCEATGGKSCLSRRADRGRRALVRRAEGQERQGAVHVVAVRRGLGQRRLARLEAREPDSGLRRACR